MASITPEGKIGIALALFGIGGAGALFVLPHPYADIVGWSLIAVAVIGLTALGFNHLTGRSGTRWIKPAIGIAILCVIFGGGFIASHWPTGFLQPASRSSVPEPTMPIASRLTI